VSRCEHIVVLIALAGCGRIAFDARDDAAVSDATSPPGTCGFDSTLVACYAFEHSVGDATPNNNDAVPVNVTYVPGKVGAAVHVDATTTLDIAANPSLAVTTMVTIEAWIDPDAFPVTGRAVIFDRNSGLAMSITPASELLCGVEDSTQAGYTIQVTGGLAVGSWHHVACTYDSTKLAAWIDGTLLFMAPNALGINTVGLDGAEIGGNKPDASDGNPDRFVGAIDELRMWNRARSAAELCADAGTC
jgi:hypothetical protein